MFAGLPELGISNGEDLKETLTNCTEPLKAIDQFQVTPNSLMPRVIECTFRLTVNKRSRIDKQTVAYVLNHPKLVTVLRCFLPSYFHHCCSDKQQQHRLQKEKVGEMVNEICSPLQVHIFELISCI